MLSIRWWNSGAAGLVVTGPCSDDDRALTGEPQEWGTPRVATAWLYLLALSAATAMACNGADGGAGETAAGNAGASGASAGLESGAAGGARAGAANPDAGAAASSPERPPPGAFEAIAVSAGGCAILKDRSAVCWGENGHGQCGDGTRENRLVPAPVLGLSDVVQISTKSLHTCALREGGEVVCWGSNLDGRLGGSMNEVELSPVALAGLPPITSLSVGGQHSCALAENGEVFCWGSGTYGQLGNLTSSGRDPTPVDGISDAVAVSAGSSHSCALRQDGTVLCWGLGAVGQLGDGQLREQSFEPVQVEGLRDATAIGAGGLHTCALRSTGEVSCWGGAETGQIGDGDTFTRVSPVAVASLSDATAIAVGGGHSCALRANREVVCWGGSGAGQIGDGGSNPGNWSPVPSPVVDLSDVTAISAAGASTCALRDGGEVLCWGLGQFGGNGNGDTANQSAPVLVAGF